MVGPDAAQLARGAQRLRELAKSLRGRADRVERLLKSVQALDMETTWKGPYPTEFHGAVAGWNAALVTAAAALRTRAAFLESVAKDKDAEVEALRRVKVQGVKS